MEVSLTQASTSNRRKGLERKLASYAVASGAFLAFSPNPAHASTIAYSGPEDITIPSEYYPSAGSYSMNLTGTGPLSGTPTDFVFGVTTAIGTFLDVSDPTSGNAVYDATNSSEAALAAGTLISSSSTFDSGTSGSPQFMGKIFKGESVGGDWGYAQNQYLGLSFVVAGQTYYGWAELTFPDNSGTAATLQGWAYDYTPGEGILAGDMGSSAVPEPPTIALSLLALGWAGLSVIRRSRKQVQAPVTC